MLEKPLAAITRADIEALVTNRRPEGREIEYKLELPGTNDDARREFLADVASFANTSGGDVIYGVRGATDTDGKATGLPEEIVGVSLNKDAEQLRLDSMIRDGIDPAVPAVQYQAVEGFARGPVLIVRIPRSWRSPHMVTFRNHSRFYARAASGKYQLDVGQLREAFVAPERLRERIETFRQERLASIASDETPVPLPAAGGRTVLHVVPVVAFAQAGGVGLTREQMERPEGFGAALPPLGHGGYNVRSNFDGYLSYSGQPNEPSDSYCQVFRTGAVEGVQALNPWQGSEPAIPSATFEQGLVQTAERYLAAFASWRVSGPFLIMLSLLRVKGFYMAVNYTWRTRGDRIDRDHLAIPEVYVESVGSDISVQDVALLMRPALDTVWQAAGWPHSVFFNAEGIWRPR